MSANTLLSVRKSVRKCVSKKTRPFNLEIYPHYACKSLVAKSQHFLENIFHSRTANRLNTPWLLTNTTFCQQLAQTSSCSLQSSWSFLFFVGFFFSLSRAHLTAWMRAQRKADGNTICSLSNSRGRQNARLMASSNHKASLIQLHLIA